MNVTDLEGRQITVIDLDAAIRLAEEYKGYEHLDKRYAALDRELKAYWTDLHEKLLTLKTKCYDRTGNAK